MRLKCHTRIKDGKEHRYWSIVESLRCGRARVVQRHILYLGEINDAQREGWPSMAAGARANWRYSPRTHRASACRCSSRPCAWSVRRGGGGDKRGRVDGQTGSGAPAGCSRSCGRSSSSMSSGGRSCPIVARVAHDIIRWLLCALTGLSTQAADGGCTGSGSSNRRWLTYSKKTSPSPPKTTFTACSTSSSRTRPRPSAICKRAGKISSARVSTCYFMT